MLSVVTLQPEDDDLDQYEAWAQAGGSGRTAWELWSERLNRTSSTGVSVHFPWMEKHTPARAGIGRAWYHEICSQTALSR
jgi:hypothetical protein